MKTNYTSKKLIFYYLGVALWGGILYLPYLGLQGLWDPWETHYSEVARRILVDGDWITLKWHNEFFFSKPALLFWTIAISFKIFGVNELAARLPTVVFSILGLLLILHYVRKIFGLRAGLFTTAIISTSPIWAMISRQAMTDMEFVSTMSIGTLSLLYCILNEKNSRFDAYLGYFCLALATLAKGLIGCATTGAIFLCFLVCKSNFGLIKRIRILEGIVVFCIFCLPWYLAISILHGKDFLYEFFFLHHIARAGGGVHGARGTFEYFITYAGWGIFPWVVFLPVSVVYLIHRFSVKINERERMKYLFLLLWGGGTFALFTISRTKFHHYIFPVIPPFAILISLWFQDRIDNPISPWEGFVIVLSMFFTVFLVREVVAYPDHMTYLFTYAYERPAGGPAFTGAVMSAVFIVSVFAILIQLTGKGLASKVAAGLFFMLAAALTIELIQFHMPRVALHISQKESFNLWEKNRRKNDRFYNWKMNWRGEIFYSRDTIKKVSRLQQLRPLLAEPGRLFLISTIERYRQVDRQIERIRGRPLVKLNPHDLRYGFGYYDGPQVSAVAPPPLVKKMKKEAIEVHASMLNGAVELSGYIIEKKKVKIGHSFFVTLYFRTLKELKHRWIVFIHGERYERGEVKRFNGNHVSGEGFYGTEKWKVGQLIEDTFAVCVDYGLNPGTYHLYAGLYREKKRMEVDDGWLHDGHDRIPIGVIELY